MRYSSRWLKNFVKEEMENFAPHDIVCDAVELFEEKFVANSTYGTFVLTDKKRTLCFEYDAFSDSVLLSYSDSGMDYKVVYKTTMPYPWYISWED